MNIRKVFFWMHLIAGTVAGTIVLLMSFTGVLLTYERQFLASLERNPARTTPAPGTTRLDVDSLIAAVRQQRSDLPPNANLTLRSDSTEPAEIRAGREAAIYVNPYTGAILPVQSGGARVVFQKITSWHRWLGVEGPGRTTARAITGACNLAFLFLVVSGAYLWIPRAWSRPALRPITWFRGGLSGKARDFNWHNVFGLWMLLPLFFVVLTALPMSYPWANNLLYRMTGSEPPPPPPGPPLGPRGERGERGGTAPISNLNPLWSRAMAHVPGWQSITAPIAGGSRVAFTIDTGDGGQPQKRSTLILDTATAGVVRSESFADASAGRRLRMWSRFIHTGEAFGLIGQTLAGLASVAGVMLVWTGIALALRRWSAWRARRKREPVLEAAVAD